MENENQKVTSKTLADLALGKEVYVHPVALIRDKHNNLFLNASAVYSEDNTQKYKLKVKRIGQGKGDFQVITYGHHIFQIDITIGGKIAYMRLNSENVLTKDQDDSSFSLDDILSKQQYVPQDSIKQPTEKSLREELKDAIQQEEYERAAVLDRQIKQLYTTNKN